MAVAKSYEGLKTLCDPYKENGKMYVNVQLKGGNEKKVRWYTDKEYAKMYGLSYAPGVEAKQSDCAFDTDGPYPKWTPYGYRLRSLRDTLGFGDKGFIWIFKGDTYEYKDYFKSIGCTYRRNWGWGLENQDTPPENLPDGIEAVKLEWNMVADNPDHLLDDQSIINAVEELTFDPRGSYQGTVGQRIERTVYIERAIDLENDYGTSRLFVMKDQDGNTYSWCTKAKSWSEGTFHCIRGTVKEHKSYKGERTTVLTRCNELDMKGVEF